MARTKIINGYPFIQYIPKELAETESLSKSKQFLEDMKRRRSIRHFSNRPVPQELIKNILAVANTAPLGANKQPWTFCAIQEATIKTQIHMAAEKEEYKSYNGRIPEEWLKDLAPLQTDWKKDFLETAPWLIVVFKKSYDIDMNGKKKQLLCYGKHRHCHGLFNFGHTCIRTCNADAYPKSDEFFI